MRETIAIVLGDRYAVEGFTPDEFLQRSSSRLDVDLLIVADDALPPEQRTTLAHTCPILWLQSRTDRAALAPGQGASIPRSFNPEELRSHVEDLLTHPLQRPLASSALSAIEPPVLPHEATELARRAVATRFPVLICGEPGTGKARLARTIHSLGRDGRFVALSAATCVPNAFRPAAGIAPGNLTVFVHDVGGLTDEGQQWLRELLDCGGFSSDLGWHAVRLICAASPSLETLARTDRFAKDLFYRLNVFPITLPPLRERTDDIPALAGHLAAGVTRALFVEPVTFTDRAIQRLTRYLWFGNLAEFEAVLTRTVALARSRTIDAGDLLFGYGRLTPRQPSESRAVPSAVAQDAKAGETVDLIINELAHEFKNPMVTIKTVTQHIERLLADQAGREQVARLTGEAVDRMDRTLENLLQFTRFRTPVAQEIPLNALLAPCLTEVTPALSERRVLLDYQPPEPLPVFVDAAQIAYAFENLLRVIARDLQEGQTLTIRIGRAPVAVTFEFSGTAHSLAGRLSDLLGHPSNGQAPALPLGLVFAKALIERNGGRMEIHSPTDAITVWLPSREEVASANGKSTNLGG